MTTHNIDDTLKAIADIAGRADPGIQSMEYITDKPPTGVWAIPYLNTGSYTQEPANVLKGLHDVGLYVVCPRVDLPKTAARLYPLGEKVAAALENEPTLLDTCSTFGEITYTFGYAINVGTPAQPAYVAGWNFTITNVKLQDDEAIT